MGVIYLMVDIYVPMRSENGVTLKCYANCFKCHNVEYSQHLSITTV